MAKYFYVYSATGATDSIVKMLYTETGTVSEQIVGNSYVDGFVNGLKANGFVLNDELAKAGIAEAEAKRILEEKTTAYQMARDTYARASETLKKIKAKYGIK